MIVDVASIALDGLGQLFGGEVGVGHTKLGEARVAAVAVLLLDLFEEDLGLFPVVLVESHHGLVVRVLGVLGVVQGAAALGGAAAAGSRPGERREEPDGAGRGGSHDATNQLAGSGAKRKLWRPPLAYRRGHGVEPGAMEGKVPMTPEGNARLRDELKNLKEVERHKISREIGVARDHGDLSENAEYHAAKDRQGWIEARIKDLEDKLSRAEVIDPAKLSGSKVAFGATVKLSNVDTEEESVYRLVGATKPTSTRVPSPSPRRWRARSSAGR